MTIYYLMVKTHNITGLKYLCQTKRKDPHKYLGSGTRWWNHLNKHGKTITTEIIRECETHEELTYYGLQYSNLWNVVESDEWANLKPESGTGGMASGENNHFYHKKHTDKTKELMREHSPDKSGSNNPNWRGGPEFHKNKKKFTNETDRQRAQSNMMLENNPMSDPKVRQKHLESARNRPVFVCQHCGVSMVKAGLVVHQIALARKGILVG